MAPQRRHWHWPGLLLGLLFFASPSEAQHYHLWDLGTLGGKQSWGTGINRRGDVSGYSEVLVSRDVHAFLWTHAAGLIDLGHLIEGYSKAWDLNDARQVVGTAQFGPVGNRAVLWEDGRLVIIGSLGGLYAEAMAINNQRQVVGSSSLEGQTGSHAFIWQEGTMSDLGTLGGNYAWAFDINDLGQVVGLSSTPAGGNNYHAFLWQEGAMTDLGTLGGPYSIATAINDAGQVVGWSLDEHSDQHQFIWQNGVMTDLGVIGDPAFPSSLQDINISETIVGTAHNPAHPGEITEGFVWRHGVMRWLDDLLVTPMYLVYWPAAINSSSLIAGSAVIQPYPESHAVLLTPVNLPVEE